MNQKTDNDISADIEAAIDQKGLRYVLDLLSEICFQKSAHLQNNWQDKQAADNWDKVGDKICIASREARERAI